MLIERDREILSDPQQEAALYRGVRWHKRNKQFTAQITHEYKDYWLGFYNDAESAARVFDVAENILRSGDAEPNFDGQPPAGMPHAAILMRLIKAGALGK